MILHCWLRLLRPYIITFLIIQLLTRIFLFFYSHAFSSASAIDILKILCLGFVFDIIALLYTLIAIIVLHLLFAKPSASARQYSVMRFASFFFFVYLWLFTACSEFFFWQEFGTRFNFIAVDYLIYTNEVIGNIAESYPLWPLLSCIALIDLILTWLWRHALKTRPTIQNTKLWYIVGLILLGIPFVVNYFIDDSIIPNYKDNIILQELSKNGTYAFVSAYQNNELSYKEFYSVLPDSQVATRIRQLLGLPEKNFVNNKPDNIIRKISHAGPEIHKNVIMVVMESLSGSYMQAFGNTQGLTQNLDQLAKEGLFFRNLYATGTRTVRGLEALSLSIPPTPGQSIIRRKNNGNLFTIGSVFRDRGYDTAFIYGGYGYFDNMNAYYAANHFRVVDRSMMKNDKVEFTNVWGISDEDLFRFVIEEATAVSEKKQPFFFMVMTTSNHLPFTYPEGKIDLPSKKSGRNGGVKYADYAVGQLIKGAKSQPWFKDTIFIFVSDHTAGVAGKSELNISEYHIPAIFYAPGFIKPQVFDGLSSQIDLPPVLFGLLNFSYYTKFFGEDWLHPVNVVIPHAFISTYQKIGLLRGGELAVLGPKRRNVLFKDDVRQPLTDNPQLIDDAITYYQYSSDWRQRMAYIPSVINNESKQ